MANPLSVGDLLEVIVPVVNNEQCALNVFHFHVQNLGVNIAQDIDVAEYASGQIETHYKALLDSDSTFWGVGCRILNHVPTYPIAAYTADRGPGVLAPPTLPRQTCGIISWKTGFAGRKARGRTYIPFPSVVSDTGDGIPTVVYVDNLATLASNVLGILNISVGGRTAGIHLCLGHKVPRPPKPAPPPFPPIVQGPDIIDFTAKPLWATQRRRGSFGRPNSPPF